MKNDGNLYPEIYNLLNELPEEILNYNLHKERHPAAIYNISLLRVSNAFSNVLNNLGSLDKISNETESAIDLLESQKELLYSLQAHIDDCYKILKVTSPIDDKITTKHTEQWLTRTKHPTYSYFSKSIEEYKEKTGKIVNNIKHHHARIRKITMNVGYNINGYYIEGTDLNSNNEVMICPDPEIHPKYTAFSFSRDLGFHFYNLYEISFYLTKALIKAIKELYNIEIKDLSYYEDENIDLKGIAKKIESINLDFFHDEYYKPIPLICVTEYKNDEILAMKMDKLWFEPYFYTNPSFYYYVEMDGITKIIQQPYMGYFIDKYGNNIEDIKLLDFKEVIKP